MAWKNPHFIILDEPTNHLDIESIDVLAQALNAFQGGVILVTHDQRLLTLICNEMWICQDGKLIVWDSDFDAYKKMIANS